jgi:hypothetical protein
MPTIAIVDGVRLVIHLRDNLPPHLHAIFADSEAQISIVTGEVLHGSLPRAKMRAVQGWLAANREEAAYMWVEREPGRAAKGCGMKLHRITGVEPVRYPVLQVTFDDGLSGEYDLTDIIDEGPLFAPLKDEAYFRTVSVVPSGRSFGWNLDVEGEEIDFCPDATRIKIETNIVEELAARYRRRRTAAE